MQNRCAEIKIRAERKAVEMLAETVEHGGDRKSESSSHCARLKNLGLTYSDSSRWQSIASIPEEEFERHIEETKRAKQELTSAGALRLARPNVAICPHCALIITCQWLTLEYRT